MNDWYIPLMHEPFTREDILSLKKFLDEDNIPRLTNGKQTELAEEKFAKWLGVKYAIAVNSGASANELTMLGMKKKFGNCQVLLPPLTWSSDWFSVIHAGLKPLTCDINLKNLSFDMNRLSEVIEPDTRVIFLTHVLGLNALTDELLGFCREKDILLIEDACESTGAMFGDKKVGSVGFAGNFSGYAAHHFSGIEFGFITTDDEDFYDYMRAIRSHGMLRECKSEERKRRISAENPELNPDFIFIGCGHNYRTTELNSTIVLSQLDRLDSNNQKRIDNFEYFVKNIDADKYHVDWEMEGQCNYAFLILLKNKTIDARNKLQRVLRENKIEFRQGLSGGGSQLKQPYLKGIMTFNDDDFPNMNYVNASSVYVGNYPTLEREKLDRLIFILNSIDYNNGIEYGI